MGRGLTGVDPLQAWRVAALSMMGPRELHDILAGTEATAWVQAAAACGIAEAQVRFGRMLLEGRGAVRDPRAAFVCFQNAAAGGSVDALNMLGRCFEQGWGVRRDLSQAARCYRGAAEAGLAWAQYNLGHMLLAGAGARRDRKAAFIWYTRAAAQRHERAMNLVGRCYEEGWGVGRDPEAAMRWYRRSAERGYFRGAYNYASILASRGRRAEASSWFKLAVSAAPEPTRSTMLARLRDRDAPFVRDLGLPQDSIARLADPNPAGQAAAIFRRPCGSPLRPCG